MGNGSMIYVVLFRGSVTRAFSHVEPVLEHIKDVLMADNSARLSDFDIRHIQLDGE